MECPPPRRPVTSALADQPSTARSRSYPAHCPEWLSGYYGTKDLGTPSCAVGFDIRTFPPRKAVGIQLVAARILGPDHPLFSWLQSLFEKLISGVGIPHGANGGESCCIVNRLMAASGLSRAVADQVA